MRLLFEGGFYWRLYGIRNATLLNKYYIYNKYYCKRGNFRVFCIRDHFAGENFHVYSIYTITNANTVNLLAILHQFYTTISLLPLLL